MQEPVAVNTVCDHVVSNGYCVGCGTCAGVCGAGALRMDWNSSGVPEPVLNPELCKVCNQCLTVCPMNDQNEDVGVLGQALFPEGDGVTGDPVLGNYQALYAGYSTIRGNRENGAGGGITTWFLETLLRQDVVDKVVCVVPGNDPDRLFEFAALDSPEGVRNASRSAYYPVEISRIVAEMNNTDARFVVVGLPCVIKGLRLVTKVFPRVRERLVMTVGLVCGQARSRYFAEFLCAKCGVAPSAVERVKFRVKDTERHQLDHRFECYGKRGEKAFQAEIYQTDGMGWLWGHDCFKIDGCNFCDDITAEAADISFADAVDEPYCYGNGGSNFVIVRSRVAQDVLESGARAGELFLASVDSMPVRKRMEGVELVKRRDLGHRLHLMQEHDGVSVPTLRQKARRRDDEQENAWMKLRDTLRTACCETYAAHRHESDVVVRVEQVIEDILNKDGLQ